VSVEGCGGLRRLMVVTASQSCWSWFGGHGLSVGDGMVVVARWSCPPHCPSTWMVDVGVDHMLRARLLSLFRSCLSV
jgi:hypothetical protein